MDALAGIGDNSGTMDAATAIKTNLTERHPDVVKRSGELAGMLERAPKAVDNEADANKISEAIRQCTAFVKIATETRVKEKEPYLAGGRAVDGFFANLIDAVDKTKKVLLSVRTSYDVAVESEARRQREEAARIQREEADRQAAVARSAQQKDRAAVAEVVAQEAEEAALAKPAELTRTRTDTGVVTSLRREWRHRITDAKKVPKKFMAPDDGLIKAALKAAVKPDGTVDFDYPGIEIYQHTFSQVR